MGILNPGIIKRKKEKGWENRGDIRGTERPDSLNFTGSLEFVFID